MENQRMLSTQEAVVGGTEGGPGPTGISGRGRGGPFRDRTLGPAKPFQVPGGPVIRLVTPPYFLATKLTAFHDRGRHDPMISHDLEDIIAVVDGRASLVTELESAPPEVRAFVAAAWQELLETGTVPALLEAHLSPDESSQARAGLVLSRIEAMSRIGHQ